MTQVDMWFDPICPYAWMTSRWLLNVEHVRDVHVSFHVMSLAVLNENKNDLDDYYKELMTTAWGPARLCIAAEQLRGNEILRPLYNALGMRYHNAKRKFNNDVFIEVLEETGLPHTLIASTTDTSLDAALRASHHEGMDPVGDDVGTPVLHVPKSGDTNAATGKPEKTAFFGPVLIPAPKGEDAGMLWDGVLNVANCDAFFELKRTRTRSPSFD